MRKITTIADLYSNIPRSDNLEGSLVYRGQGRNWPLTPGLVREPNYVLNSGSWDSYEQMLLRLFKKEAEPFLTVRPETNVEWIVLAQHHGLPTRCIDWTHSLFVALYFAVEDLQEEHDGVIWILDPAEVTFRIVDEWNVLRDLAKVLFHPVSNKFERVAAQRAVVTIHPLPKEAEPFVSFDADYDEDKLNPMLSCLIVPGASKFSLLRDLSDAGFSRQHIYPGLDGICADIRWRLKRFKTMHGDSNQQIVTMPENPFRLDLKDGSLDWLFKKPNDVPENLEK